MRPRSPAPDQAKATNPSAIASSAMRSRRGPDAIAPRISSRLEMSLPPPRTLVVAFAFFGYLALALSVRNLYPLSTFEMYAGAPATTAPSRVIARDAAGVAHEIDEYVAWTCEGPTPLGPAGCASEWPYAFSIYLDRAAADWIDAHRVA